MYGKLLDRISVRRLLHSAIMILFLALCLSLLRWVADQTSFETTYVVGTIWVLGLITLMSLLRPHMVQFSVESRPISTAERDELEGLCDAFGENLRGVKVLEHPNKAVWIEIAGIVRNNRQLLVSESFFEEYSPSQRRAAIALEVTHARKHVRVYHMFTWLVVLLAYVGLEIVVENVAGTGGQLNLLPEVCLLVAIVLVVRYGKKRAYDADATAARLTSPDQIIEVIEKNAKHNDSPMDRNWLSSFVRMKPTRSQRIARLREELAASDSKVPNDS